MNTYVRVGSVSVRMRQGLRSRTVDQRIDREHKGRGMRSLRTTARQVSQAIVLTAALVPWAAKAADAASPISQLRRGERVAQEQCSACHLVAKKQQFLPLLKAPAPSFQSIADRPQTSETKLRVFLATTHWDLKTVPITMPNPHLSNADGAVVVRYILSLRGR